MEKDDIYEEPELTSGIEKELKALLKEMKEHLKVRKKRNAKYL